MEKLDSIIFFQLDRAIKSYRQFAQQQLNEKGFSITIDQWLVLKTILDHEEMSQNEIAAYIFKDKASVTRIIDLLIEKKYLKKDVNRLNRRRMVLTITPKGKEIINQILPTIRNNRKHALQGCDTGELEMMADTLEKIIKNCSKSS